MARPSRRPLRGLLRMRNIGDMADLMDLILRSVRRTRPLIQLTANGSKVFPHPEERPKDASRRTHPLDPTEAAPSRPRSLRVAPDVLQERDERRRRHAADAGRGAERRRPGEAQLVADFVGEAADRIVVEIGRQAQRLVTPEGADIRLLALEIAGVAG